MSRRKQPGPPDFVVVVEHRRPELSKLEKVATVVSFVMMVAAILFEPRRRI